MNVLLIAVILLFFVLAVVGMHRGFLKSVLPFAAMLLASVLLTVFAPFIRDALIRNTQLDEKLAEGIRGKLEEVFHGENAAEGSPAEGGSGADSPAGQFLPEGLQELFGAHPDIQSLPAGTDLSTRLSASLASVVLTAMVYVIGFPLLYVIFMLIGKLLGTVTQLPLLHQADQLLGLLLGVVMALIATELAFFLITCFSGTGFGQKMMKMIADSSLLSFLYKINLSAVLFR